jgi:repressor LexA
MLNDRLRAARLLTGLTQAEFAHRIGVERNTVTRLEGGHGAPSADTLAAWARVCGVSTDSLLGLTETPADHAARSVNGAAE